MHYLSVGALFRNESHSIVEWIEHYIFHGVDHFYLIDDNSDDNTCELLEPYISRGLVTLFKSNHSRYLGRQRDMYNQFILPCFNRKETQWLVICDIDEYVWSHLNIDLKLVLQDMMMVAQIQFNHTIFGSSGHETQPKCIVGSFTKRSENIPTQTPGNIKYILNSNFEFSSINVHHATFVHESDKQNNQFLILDNYFRMNHYNCQSREFWINVKCTRGDSDQWKVRSLADFEEVDLNNKEDTTLFLQNKPMLERLGLV
jgi:hypothetical protein